MVFWYYSYDCQSECNIHTEIFLIFLIVTVRHITLTIIFGFFSVSFYYFVSIYIRLKKGCGSGWSWSESSTTYNNRLWVRILILPSRKTASDLRNKTGSVLQNKTGSGSNSQNINIKYKYLYVIRIEWLIFIYCITHGVRTLYPWILQSLF